MKNFLYDVTVFLGRLFMACFYLFMIMVSIPFLIIVSFLELMDGTTKQKFERAQKEYID